MKPKVQEMWMTERDPSMCVRFFCNLDNGQERGDEFQTLELPDMDLVAIWLITDDCNTRFGATVLIVAVLALHGAKSERLEDFVRESKRVPARWVE